jgi:hypothetical protein
MLKGKNWRQGGSGGDRARPSTSNGCVHPEDDRRQQAAAQLAAAQLLQTRRA